ncbi:efflux RND transporter periplasmic adaptor subunit [Marinobacterium sp. AK62]|uniref:Efflux RND transporter periplasmic adaptor subunit n=1 Tax=Marinobacterium alkalitolerans TaxID=1542925 RepID=A0ABS3ZCH7_9GAMM|nr:efflux RND transporter periplasmic adaptor subunit [Marinobacterium alkalitolerans]MBP0049400.1 efflux RND transporter periplasmic adaptor subunit [Marinobacterium alkalitolerans]
MKPLSHTLLFILATFSSLAAAEEGSGKPQGLPAEVIRVEAQQLDTRISAVGVLEANESVMLSPEQSGRISQILFDEGEQVNAGQPLIKLDSAIYEAALEQARARVRLSQLEYERSESLLQKRVGSQTDRDGKLAQLQVDRAELALAQTRLDKMTVRAPFEGTLGLRQVSPGDFVSVGQSLVELADTSRLKVQFSIPERHLDKLSTGQTIDITVDAFRATPLKGTIYAIAPSVNPNSHNVQVRARVPNPEGTLKPGLFVRILIPVEQNDHALVVPEQALILDGDKTFLMRMNEQQQVSLTPVETGARRYGEVQIVSGIEAGDVIVTAGHLKLRPGMPITPVFPTQETGEGKDA